MNSINKPKGINEINEINETIVLKQNVGIDISKENFKVSFQQLLLKQGQQSIRIKGSRTFKNTSSGFQALQQWVERKKSLKHIHQDFVYFTMEATGVYYENLAHFLAQREDYQISVVLPNKAKAFFKSLNLKSKTDKIDASALGKMGLERKLEKWCPPTRQIQQLKQLTRDRQALVEYKTALSNRLHAIQHSYQPHRQVIKRLRQQLRLIQKQIKEVETQISTIFKNDPVLRSHQKHICAIKGIGITTLAVILAETNAFQLFDSQAQLTSFAGYDVVYHESGTSIRGKTRISKKGNKHIRRALHFPALIAIRFEQRFQQLYQRIYQRSKIKMKALVAVQRKLLLIIYTLVKKKQPYDPVFLSKVEHNNSAVLHKNSRQDTSLAYTG